MTRNDSIALQFVSESLRLLDTAESCVLKLEEFSKRDTVDELFRSIHTIKGNSGLFDATNLRDLAHAFESLLIELRDEKITASHECIDVMLLAIDRLRTLIRAFQADETVAVDDLVLSIEECKSKTESKIGAFAPQIKSSSQGSTARQSAKKGTLRINGGLKEKARELGQYLYVVLVDPLELGLDSVTKAADWATSLTREGHIQQVAVLPELISGLGNGSDTLPICAVLATVESPNEFLQRRGIPVRRLQILAKPTPLAPEKSAEVSRQSPVKDNEPKDIQAKASQSKENQNKDIQAKENQSKENHVDTHLRVPFGLIEGLINLAGEAVIARNELLQRVQTAADHAIKSSAKKVGQIVTRLQEGIMRTRLQDLDAVFQRLPRILRDAALATGKQVKLVLEGREVELDKSLIETIGEALTHLVRNAVDHGIEDTTTREKSGKSPIGTVKISAKLTGGNVFITVNDDGKGLDLARIRELAKTNGLLPADQITRMSADEVAELIFLPGFSTAETVTETSGRGIGMDAVRSSVRKSGGVIHISTEAGQGTTFTISVPQTLSISTCLLVREAGQRYALPQQNVQELLSLDPEQLKLVETHAMYEVRGKMLPILPLSRVLDLKEDRLTTGHIAIVKTERHRFGLLIQEIISPEEIVIRPLSEHISVELFSGAAIMGDGEAVLVLDINGIARFTGLQATAAESVQKANGQLTREHLLFEASGRVFALWLSGSPRILQIQRHQIEPFMGRLTFRLGTEILSVRLPSRDFGLEPDLAETLYLIIAGDQKIAIACSTIRGVVSLGEPDNISIQGPGVIGACVYEERTVIVLDGDALFSTVPSATQVEV